MPDSTELMRQLAEHTRPLCGGPSCGHVGEDRCCSPTYCEAADKEARERGIILPRQDHPRLPFMGQTGCVVPPHLRPVCTLHNCSIASVGFTDDEAWDERYYELREAAGDAMWEEMKRAGEV